MAERDTEVSPSFLSPLIARSKETVTIIVDLIDEAEKPHTPE